MVSMMREIVYIYANRGWKFDLLFSIFLSFFVIYFFDLTSLILKDENILKNFIDSLNAVTTFFEIFVGFLLTTFSLLFTFTPKKGSNLDKIRSGDTYRKMLYSILFTSFLIIIYIPILIYFNLFISKLMIILFIFISFLILLRIFKCLFYLYYIIEIESKE